MILSSDCQSVLVIDTNEDTRRYYHYTRFVPERIQEHLYQLIKFSNSFRLNPSIPTPWTRALGPSSPHNDSTDLGGSIRIDVATKRIMYRKSYPIPQPRTYDLSSRSRATSNPADLSPQYHHTAVLPISWLSHQQRGDLSDIILTQARMDDSTRSNALLSEFIRKLSNAEAKDCPSSQTVLEETATGISFLLQHDSDHNNNTILSSSYDPSLIIVAQMIDEIVLVYCPAIDFPSLDEAIHESKELGQVQIWLPNGDGDYYYGETLSLNEDVFRWVESIYNMAERSNRSAAYPRGLDKTPASRRLSRYIPASLLETSMTVGVVIEADNRSIAGLIDHHRLSMIQALVFRQHIESNSTIYTHIFSGMEKDNAHGKDRRVYDHQRLFFHRVKDPRYRQHLKVGYVLQQVIPDNDSIEPDNDPDDPANKYRSRWDIALTYFYSYVPPTTARTNPKPKTAYEGNHAKNLELLRVRVHFTLQYMVLDLEISNKVRQYPF